MSYKTAKEKANFNYITSNFKLPDKYKKGKKVGKSNKEDLIINYYFQQKLKILDTKKQKKR